MSQPDKPNVRTAVGRAFRAIIFISGIVAWIALATLYLTDASPLGELSFRVHLGWARGGTLAEAK